MTTRRHLPLAASAALVAGLLLFVALLSGHCARPVLAPHAGGSPTASSAPASVGDPSQAVALPADHSCVTESPAVLATPATTVHDAPAAALAADEPSTALPVEPAAQPTTDPRGPPRAPHPSTIELGVLRV